MSDAHELRLTAIQYKMALTMRVVGASVPQCHTFPISTEDERVALVDRIVQSPDDFRTYLDVDLEPEVTYLYDSQSFRRALQFHRLVASHEVPTELPHLFDGYCPYICATFLIDTRETKLALADWIINKQFGKFRRECVEIFKTSIAVHEGTPTAGPRGALYEVTDALFECKEQLSDEAYRRVNNALKRVYDAI